MKSPSESSKHIRAQSLVCNFLTDLPGLLCHPEVSIRCSLKQDGFWFSGHQLTRLLPLPKTRSSQSQVSSQGWGWGGGMSRASFLQKDHWLKALRGLALAKKPFSQELQTSEKKTFQCLALKMLPKSGNERSARKTSKGPDRNFSD